MKVFVAFDGEEMIGVGEIDMKVFVAFNGEEMIGVYETLEKARDALREQGFTHYPVGHPDQERLCLWGARWLKEVGITRRRWVRGYITDEVVR